MFGVCWFVFGIWLVFGVWCLFGWIVDLHLVSVIGDRTESVSGIIPY